MKNKFLSLLLISLVIMNNVYSMDSCDILIKKVQDSKSAGNIDIQDRNKILESLFIDLEKSIRAVGTEYAFSIEEWQNMKIWTLKNVEQYEMRTGKTMYLLKINDDLYQVYLELYNKASKKEEVHLLGDDRFRDRLSKWMKDKNIHFETMAE